MPRTPRTPWPDRAAQYLRMSREHQRYSPLNQAAAIAKYADQHGLRIVRTYRDDGRSGVTLRGRKGLQRLLADVLGGSAEFGHVLVLDVSRWGRFQDPDQAAHYEFLCREAGVRVTYCGEPFGEEVDAVAGVLKHLKRVMAAEFSRELGDKVWAGQASSFDRGNKLGGAAPFGTRRLLMSTDGSPVRILERGQHRAVQTERVVLVQGPENELDAIRRIFRWFTVDRLSVREIARRLAAGGAQFDDGRPLLPRHISGMLRNEIYVGQYSWNKTCQRLRRGTRRNARRAWLTRPMVEPIVSRRQFAAAQRRLSMGNEPTYSDADLLSLLRELHATHGEVTFADLRALRKPSVALFYHRFGSLAAALELAGCPRFIRERPVDPETWKPMAELVSALAAALAREGFLSADVINADPALPSATHIRRRFGNLIKAYNAAGWDVNEEEVRPLANARRWRRNRASEDLPDQLRQDIVHGN
jgi:DNA invertase Pin-like site-specific DNA recombinase